MKSSFSPNKNKMKLIKSLNLSLQPPSPDSYKRQNNNILFTLPPIDSVTKKQELMKPTSLLTRFIHDRTRTIINTTKSELKKPIKISIENLNKIKDKKSKEKRNNIFLTNDGTINKKESGLNDNYTINTFLDKYDKNNNNDNLSSLSIDRQMKENRVKYLIPKFRRARIYQPIISENWKFKNGLRVTIGNEKTNILAFKNDIEYQYKIINDEFKLLEDNYSYYKTRVLIKNNYYDAFKAMPLPSKISFNKCLEETIGILYVLPQLLLVEFYRLIKNYSSVNIPKHDLFKEKFIFDENKNLLYNNNLLIKVFDFFKACYEVYGTLIKEVNDMYLKSNEFLNVINCLEKARYNLSYVSTSSENFIKKYCEDIKFIQKIINEKDASRSIDLSEKLRNQFGFKKNEEKQRKLRIETALYNKNDKEDEDFRRDNNHRKKFTSVVESKLINGLMNYFNKDIKNQVTTYKINKELGGNLDDDEELKGKHKVVKIDF
jgi:hypothetical protein